MKLAEIPQPSLTYSVLNYAQEHNFMPIEIMAQEQFANLSVALQSCFRLAKEKGAAEFCVNEIRQEYDLQTETGHWRISIVAFIPRKCN